MTSPVLTSTLKVDLDLIKKYNVPGPRYTSYPPATHFREDVSGEQLVPYVRRNNELEIPRPLSLYYHLPFCYSLCWYCGCTTVITTRQAHSREYIAYLDREMEWMGRHLDPDRPVKQMHFGGGTPTYLLPEEIRELGGIIRRRFRFDPDIEAGVEMDPRRMTRDHVRALREVGFNRASMGVQDNNPVVQKAVHRIQPLEMTTEAVGWIREEGFDSLNIDLIYGLPLQTPASFEKTLEEILELRPERFAVFNYAHVPWIKPAQKILKEKDLPAPETKLELLKLIIETLTGSGYVYIGMDHFARPDDELAVAQREKSLQRNFQGYSTRGDADIYGFGMSSISQTPDCYWQNHKDLPVYYGRLEADEWVIAKGYIPTDDDKLRRQTIMRLMCDLSLDYQQMSTALGIDFADYFAPELASLSDMEADGLLCRTEDGLEVTEFGRLLIRNIAMRFDAYLKDQQTEGRYSRTI